LHRDEAQAFLLATDLTSRSAVALEVDGDITVLSVIERGLPPKT
jgi:hypothetical protein